MELELVGESRRQRLEWRPWGQYFYFYGTVIKIIGKKEIKRFMLVHRLNSSPSQWEVKGQELEAAGHIAATVRKSNAMDECSAAFPIFHGLGFPPSERSSPHVRRVFPR